MRQANTISGYGAACHFVFSFYVSSGHNSQKLKAWLHTKVERDYFVFILSSKQAGQATMYNK